MASKGGRGRVCLRADNSLAGLHVTVEGTGMGTAADLDIHSTTAGTVIKFFVPTSRDGEESRIEMQLAAASVREVN